MNENLFKCAKCHNMIPTVNKIMHDIHCKEIVDTNVNPDLNTNNVNTGNNIGNNSNQTTSNRNELDKDVIMTSNTDDFWYCDKCDNYLDKQEKADHMISHQYAESVEPNGSRAGRVSRSVAVQNVNGIDNQLNRQNSANNNINVNIQSGGPGMTTVTRTIHHPNGGVTTITQTTSSTSSSTSTTTNSRGANRPIPSPNFHDLGSVFHNHPFFSPMINTGPGGPRTIEQLLIHAMGGVPENPVSEDILSELPEFKIEDLNKIPQEKKDCVICMNTFVKNDTAIILPCTHLFHSDCIKNWFKSSNTCPICKFKLDNSTINNSENIHGGDI
jgi:hypothetical protein